MRKTSIKYSFMPEESYIRDTMNLSAHDKLMWLAETNNFVSKFVSKKKLKIWEKFRKGEI